MPTVALATVAAAEALGQHPLRWPHLRAARRRQCRDAWHAQSLPRLSRRERQRPRREAPVVVAPRHGSGSGRGIPSGPLLGRTRAVARSVTRPAAVMVGTLRPLCGPRAALARARRAGGPPPPPGTVMALAPRICRANAARPPARAVALAAAEATAAVGGPLRRAERRRRRRRRCAEPCRACRAAIARPAAVAEVAVPGRPSGPRGAFASQTSRQTSARRTSRRRSRTTLAR
mmetsp:Transcript_131874/g.367647  ORF Transcript_131874/g.367647 Transcript_131874/m.367647 type:complete len:232 (-) Transcript_131874:254-949(-)